MVERQPSKLNTWVRFPSPALIKNEKFKVVMIIVKSLNFALLIKSAHIAQMVEHFLGKEEVTGSSPVVGSRVS